MKKIISLLLALVLIFSLSVLACADGDEAALGNEYGVEFTDEELKKLVEDVLDDMGVSKELVAVGFYATATDQTWLYNEDFWVYSASIYKLPLMMLFEQRINSGEIKRDEKFYSYDVEHIEERILQYSNNDLAHYVMDHVWSNPNDFRREAECFSDMDESEYPSNYLYLSEFNVKYTTDVVKELYFNPESYGEILKYLKLANPNEYFRLYLEGQYEIAQKYGAYDGVRHTAGIIYTPNPIILVVMTGKIGKGEQVIAEISRSFADFALELDSRVEEAKAQYEAEQELLAREQAALEAEKERAAKEAAEKSAAEKAAAELEAQQQEEQVQQRFALTLTGIIAIATALPLLVLTVVLIKRKRRIRKP